MKRIDLYILVALVIAILAVVAVFRLTAKNKLPTSTITENRYETTVPVRTVVIRESLPARIDTVYIDGTAYEIARYTDTLDTNKVYIKTDIKYDERTNLFDISRDINIQRDSVYVEKITTVFEKLPKPKLVSMTGAIGSGFKSDEKSGGLVLNSMCLDAGIKIKSKYSATLFATTNAEYGIRFGVDF